MVGITVADGLVKEMAVVCGVVAAGFGRGLLETG
jgi:hypothetical protein